MSNRLIIAGMLGVVELLILVLALKAYRDGEVTISFGDSSSRSNLLDVTIRRESHPVLFGIAVAWMLVFFVGIAVGIVVVLRGWG